MNLLRVGACSEVADGESTGNETPMGSSSRPRTAACVPAGPQRPILFHNRGTAVGPAVGPVAMQKGKEGFKSRQKTKFAVVPKEGTITH